jgi:hypothetical protein
MIDMTLATVSLTISVGNFILGIFGTMDLPAQNILNFV